MAKLKQETLGEITSHLYVLESEAGAKWIYELYVGSTTRDNNISVYLGKYRGLQIK